jgi:hypothetical protein
MTGRPPDRLRPRSVVLCRLKVPIDGDARMDNGDSAANSSDILTALSLAAPQLIGITDRFVDVILLEQLDRVLLTISETDKIRSNAMRRRPFCCSLR